MQMHNVAMGNVVGPRRDGTQTFLMALLYLPAPIRKRTQQTRLWTDVTQTRRERTQDRRRQPWAQNRRARAGTEPTRTDVDSDRRLAAASPPRHRATGNDPEPVRERWGPPG